MLWKALIDSTTISFLPLPVTEDQSDDELKQSISFLSLPVIEDQSDDELKQSIPFSGPNTTNEVIPSESCLNCSKLIIQRFDTP